VVLYFAVKTRRLMWHVLEVVWYFIKLYDMVLSRPCDGFFLPEPTVIAAYVVLHNKFYMCVLDLFTLPSLLLLVRAICTLHTHIYHFHLTSNKRYFFMILQSFIIFWSSCATCSFTAMWDNVFDVFSSPQMCHRSFLVHPLPFFSFQIASVQNPYNFLHSC
jgi:hypothetical protein